MEGHLMVGRAMDLNTDNTGALRICGIVDVIFFYVSDY